LEFKPTRGQRRISALNRDLIVSDRPAAATEEQYALFHAYQQERHGDGEMSRMSFLDYQTLVEDTPVDTHIVELREPGGRLVGACLSDWMSDGISAVYSFFAPGEGRRSLGTYIILCLLEQARDRNLPHVYLGFWIHDCQKMAYKSRFQPLEAYSPDGWRPLDPDDRGTFAYFSSRD
jgi:arginine-tRNA-protein transferase